MPATGRSGCAGLGDAGGGQLWSVLRVGCDIADSLAGVDRGVVVLEKIGLPRARPTSSMKVQAALPLRVQVGPSARRPTRRALARWAATCSAVSADRFGRVKGVGRRKAARRTDSRSEIGLLRGEGLGDWPWFAGGLALEQVADTSDADRGGILLLAETGRVALAVVKDLGDELVLLADPGADGREGLSLAGQAGQRLVAAAIDRGGDIAVGQPDSRLRGVEPLSAGPVGRGA